MAFATIHTPVDARVHEILRVVLAYAMGDFEDELDITGDDSVFDEISAGINVLGQELQSSIDSLSRSREEALAARAIAESANRAKSAFLANTSHELRTPLNAIIGYSQLLCEDISDDFPEAMHLIDDLKKIERAGQYLLFLISNLLDLSKIEAGKMELHFDTLEVQHLLHSVAEISVPLLNKNHNRFQQDFGEALGEITSDVVKIQQILCNLMSNAAKFTSRGVVTLSASRTCRSGVDWLHFAVSDTGVGIKSEQIDRLFQPFSQAHSGVSGKFGGTGLGLALCKSFTEMLGGNIDIHSVYGEGTTISLEIPAVYPGKITI